MFKYTSTRKQQIIDQLLFVDIIYDSVFLGVSTTKSAYL